jgi:hypothetical protein
MAAEISNTSWMVVGIGYVTLILRFWWTAPHRLNIPILFHHEDQHDPEAKA